MAAVSHRLVFMDLLYHACRYNGRMANHFLRDLRATFADRANNAALTHRDRTYTFGELDALAERCAVWLHNLGVSSADRVALCAADKRAFLIAHLGTIFAGAVSLPLNPRFTREEMRYFLADSGACVAIAGEEQCALLETLRPELPALKAVVADAAVMDTPKASYQEPSVSADDPCFILYSSGTTGWPKGIVHTHGNVSHALKSLARHWQFSPDDSVLNVLPVFHIHGLSIATHLSLLAGAHVHVEDSFHPVETLQAIGKATVFMAVPTIYYKFLEQPEFRVAAKNWPHVRLFTCGSAPIRPEVLPDLESILGQGIVNRYGMTESFVITSLPVSDHRHAWQPGSVGTAIDGVEFRLSNVKENVGAVSIRGPNIFREYW